jgi:hypothetical protein
MNRSTTYSPNEPRQLDRERALDELLAKQEISDAMARYCRGIDRRDEELVRSVYHSDSFDDHGFGFGGGGWDLAALVNPKNPNGFPSEWKMTHHFLGSQLTVVDGDRASSETYFVSVQRFEHEGIDYDMTSAGRYVDRWERRDGSFRISHRTVVYDWLRTDPVTTPWPGPDHDVPKTLWGAAPLPTEHVLGAPSREDYSYEVLGDV